MDAQKADVIIVGAGIAGLAMAYAAAQKGKKVFVFEKTGWAQGASIRNFGMIWPAGQPAGVMRETALQSRAIWVDLARKANFWLHENGSLHLAYDALEMQVMEEFISKEANENFSLLSPAGVLRKSEAVKPAGLKGALWSPSECLVDPREAVPKIATYLSATFDVHFFFDTSITNVIPGLVYGFDKEWEAEQIFICSGQELETLYPETFNKIPLTKCKLQMLRTEPQSGDRRIGPSLCGGLTLRHYAAFADCPSLPELSEKFDRAEPRFREWGIHVLVAQNGAGEIIIGDSHEYGRTLPPFDHEAIYALILKYLDGFFQWTDFKICERWHGVYSKMTDGSNYFFEETEPSVFIFNGLGGAGMTLSFGLADALYSRL